MEKEKITFSELVFIFNNFSRMKTSGAKFQYFSKKNRDIILAILKKNDEYVKLVKESQDLNEENHNHKEIIEKYEKDKNKLTKEEIEIIENLKKKSEDLNIRMTNFLVSTNVDIPKFFKIRNEDLSIGDEIDNDFMDLLVDYNLIIDN